MPIQQNGGMAITDMLGQRKKATDTITKILNKETKPASQDYARSMFENVAASNAYSPVQYKPREAQQVFEERRASEIAPQATMLDMIDGTIKAGGEQTKAIHEAFKSFADTDENLAALYQAAQDDPEEITSANAATFAARKARELGFRSAKSMQAEAQLNYSKAKLDGNGSPVQILSGVPSAETSYLPTDADLVPADGMLQPPEVSPGSSKGVSWTEVASYGKQKPARGMKFISDGNEIREVPMGYDPSLGVKFGEGEITEAAKKNFKFAKELSDVFSSLDSRFKPEYAQMAGVPVGGKFALEFAKRFGSTPEASDAMQFWQDFNKLQNFERNALFGSALTAGEQAAWKSANIDENTSPENVQKFIQKRKDILASAYRRALGEMAASYDINAIEQLSGVPRAEIAEIMKSNIGGNANPYMKEEGAPQKSIQDMTDEELDAYERSLKGE